MVNINVPAQDPFQGFYLAHQGSGIVDLNFQQVSPDTPDQKEGHMMDTIGNQQEATAPKDANQAGGVRSFRNFAGAMRWCVLRWLMGASYAPERCLTSMPAHVPLYMAITLTLIGHHVCMSVTAPAY